MLRKDCHYKWGTDQQLAFEQAKNILITKPVLKAPDFKKPFTLSVDASDIGIGGVLMQENNDGLLQPISYYSKKINRHQKHYSSVEKETLALISALQHFDVYINGSPFVTVVYSDHNPLVFINRIKEKNRRLLKWSLMLQDVNIEIRHIKGKDNIIADCLSR